MFGQVFDAQLQLRLADFFFAAEIAQIVQRIAQGAQSEIPVRSRRPVARLVLPRARQPLCPLLPIRDVWLSDLRFRFL